MYHPVRAGSGLRPRHMVRQHRRGLSFGLFQCEPDKSLNLCLARFPLYRSQYVCIGVSVEFEAHKDGVFPRPFFARVTLCHSINSLLRFPLDMVYNITSGRPAFAQAVIPQQFYRLKKCRLMLGRLFLSGQKIHHDENQNDFVHGHPFLSEEQPAALLDAGREWHILHSMQAPF